MERGCYVLVSEALGELSRIPLFWQIDSFPTKAAAETAKGPRGTIMEALGKIWLLSIAEEGYRPTGGTHAAEIGPLLTDAGTKYVAAWSPDGQSGPFPIGCGAEPAVLLSDLQQANAREGGITDLIAELAKCSVMSTPLTMEK
jgi:hypothetical protein